MDGRLTVLYDGWCPTCSRMARIARRLDVMGRLSFASARDPAVFGRFPIGRDRAVRRLMCLSPAGRVYEGIDAVIQIALRLPLLWPFVPLLAVSRWIGVGGPLYDVVASRRTVMAPPSSRHKGSH